MGDLIELRTRIESVCGDQPAPEFEIFLMEEGLELLADFRSIEDRSIRDAIRTMVASLTASLRSPPK